MRISFSQSVTSSRFGVWKQNSFPIPHLRHWALSRRLCSPNDATFDDFSSVPSCFSFPLTIPCCWCWLLLPYMSDLIPEDLGNLGMMGADPVHMEKQPRNRQVQSHTLISLLPGRRKSSLLWRTPQPAAAELTYGSHLRYEEAPSHTCHHLAPLLWGMERSSLSGKTGRSLRFLTMPITKWTSSENNGAVVSSLVTCQPSHLEEGCLRSETAPRPYHFGREL